MNRRPRRFYEDKIKSDGRFRYIDVTFTLVVFISGFVDG
jgi:hypothetical protein